MKLKRRNIITIINNCNSLFPPIELQNREMSFRRWTIRSRSSVDIFIISFIYDIRLIFHFFFFRAKLKKTAKENVINMLICYNSVFLLTKSMSFFEDERFDHDIVYAYFQCNCISQVKEIFAIQRDMYAM